MFHNDNREKKNKTKHKNPLAILYKKKNPMLNVLCQQNILSLPMHDMLSLQYLEVPRLRLSILVAMGKLTAASYSD